MTVFKNFQKAKQQIVNSDLTMARQLSVKCRNQLIYSPAGRSGISAPKESVRTLLEDTFMIVFSDWQKGKGWDKARKVRDNFGSFDLRMKKVDLVYSAKSPTQKDEMELGAYVSSMKPNEID